MQHISKFSILSASSNTGDERKEDKEHGIQTTLLLKYNLRLQVMLDGQQSVFER